MVIQIIFFILLIIEMALIILSIIKDDETAMKITGILGLVLLIAIIGIVVVTFRMMILEVGG